MGVITVRDVPEEVIRTLKAIAESQGRSMEEQIRTILRSVALDRKSACEQIEQAWVRQRRPTRRKEVDTWIQKSRP